MKYTCIGSVRGSCGKIHNTEEEADKCLERDQRNCSSLPGGNCYSDRRIVKGSKYSYSERCAMDEHVIDALEEH